MIEVQVNHDKIMKELMGRGPTQLTYLNALVLKMRLEGRSIKEIARAIGVRSKYSVCNHTARAMKVLGARNNFEMAYVCYERGYVTIEEKENG